MNNAIFVIIYCNDLCFWCGLQGSGEKNFVLVVILSKTGFRMSKFLAEIQRILQQSDFNNTEMPFVFGVTGPVGSGKSTLSDELKEELENSFQKSVVVLSLDDFYLPRSDRKGPRGLPGTHDLKLLERVWAQLMAESGEVFLPRFSKALDDRLPEDQWQKILAPVDVLILEGWCLGLPGLAADYQSLADHVNFWVQLRVKDFETVRRLRREQEVKDNASAMSEEEVKDFVEQFRSHFQASQDLHLQPGLVISRS